MYRWPVAVFSSGTAVLIAACTASLGELPPGASSDGSPDIGTPLCPAQDDSGVLTAFRVDGTITVDGALTESTWARTRTVDFSNAVRSDNKVGVRVAWDDENLYLAFSVIDDKLESDPNSRVFQDDGAELYLDTMHNATPQMDGDDYHFIVNIVDDIQIGNVDVAHGTLPVRTMAIIGGYAMEFAIPWSMTGGRPQAGQTMGMLLGNNDRDNGSSKQFDWVGVIDNGTGDYARPNLWGDLRLTDILADGSCL